MENTDYQIEGMTIAITNMEQMLNFYSNTFKIQFTVKKCMSLIYILELGEN